MKFSKYIVIPKQTNLTNKLIKQNITNILQDIYKGNPFEIEQLKDLIAAAKYKNIDIEKIKIDFYWKDDYEVETNKYSPIKYATYNFFVNEKGFAEVLPYFVINSNPKNSKESIENSLANMFNCWHGDEIAYVYKGAKTFSQEFQQTFDFLKQMGAKMDCFSNNIGKLGKKILSNPQFVEFLIKQNDQNIQDILAFYYFEMKNYKAYYSLLEKYNCNCFSSSQVIRKLDGTSEKIPHILYLTEKGVIDIKDFNEDSLTNVKNSINFFNPLEEIMFEKRFNEIKEQYYKIYKQEDVDKKYSNKKSLYQTSLKQDEIELNI